MNRIWKYIMAVFQKKAVNDKRNYVSFVFHKLEYYNGTVNQSRPVYNKITLNTEEAIKAITKNVKPLGELESIHKPFYKLVKLEMMLPSTGINADEGIISWQQVRTLNIQYFQ